MTLTPADRSRYSRHLALPEIGVDGQEKLKAARVLVIGAGGLGSPAAMYLAASGVGVLGILDHDRVEVSNLQRQVLFETQSVGAPKAQAAARRLRALNPDIEVRAHQEELRAANVLEILGEYDVVLDGTDRFSARYLSNDACVLLGKPLVSAAIHRFEGQAMTYAPGAGPCYRCLFPEPPAGGLIPNCAQAGVLGVLPGVMGSIQATEAIKLITGAGEPLVGRLLTYDALGMRFGEFRFPARKDCAVCGEQPTILRPQDLDEVCEALLAEVRRLSPAQLRALLGAGSPVLIDVREPREFAAGHLPGAVNVPVGSVESELQMLPRGEATVFICRSGARSLTAAALARQAGMENIAHLEGGLLAWAADIDVDLVVAPLD